MSDQDFSASIRNFCNQTCQLTIYTLTKVKEVHVDLECFQKICQIAFNVIGLAMLHYPELNYLSRFSFVLNTALMHDFYTFLGEPRKYFFPISADSIDENSTKNSFYVELKSHLFPAGAYFNPVIDSNDVDFIAKDCLTQLLEEMRKEGDSYRNVNEFKIKLQELIRSNEFKNHLTRLAADPNSNNRLANANLNLLASIDLSNITVKVHHTPLIERITNLNWIFINMGCIVGYSQGWNLIDTAKWAGKVGQYPGLSWVKDHSLEKWMGGFVFLTFSLKFLEAWRKLRDEALTAEQKYKLQWERVYSLMESVYFGASFCNVIGQTNINASYLYIFAAFTKTIGLFSKINRPKHTYFQDQIPVASAA